jgi:hypothetical protein
MKKINTIITVGLLSLLAPANVLANGLYFGGSLGSASLDSNSLVKSGNDTVRLAGSFFDVFFGSGIVLNPGASVGMHLGWKFNSRWSTEVTYTHLGVSQGSSHYSWPASSLWNAGDLRQNYSIKSQAIDLSAKYTFPSASRWKVFAEGGPAVMLNHINYHENFNGAKQMANPSGSQLSTVVGVGVGYRVNHTDYSLRTRYYADYVNGDDVASSTYAFKPANHDASAWDVNMSADFNL